MGIQNKFSRMRRFALFAVLIMLLTGCAKNTSQTEESMMKPILLKETEEETEEESSPECEFPYLLEDGALEVHSVFPYSGPNPDCQWMEAEDIGSIELVNQSGKYLNEAKLTLMLADGEALSFTVQDIRPGQSVWAFEQENKTYPQKAVCSAISCEAEFTDEAGWDTDKITAEGKGMVLTLTNHTDSELQDVQVRCHILMTGICFGGTAYGYPAGNIAAGASTKIMADDCIIGDVTAAWIGN